MRKLSQYFALASLAVKPSAAMISIVRNADILFFIESDLLGKKQHDKAGDYLQLCTLHTPFHAFTITAFY